MKAFFVICSVVLLFSVSNVLGAKSDKGSEKGASKAEAPAACCPAHKSESACPTDADKKSAATCAVETEKAGKVVVTVNGTKITESEVAKQLGERVKAELARTGRSGEQVKPDELESMEKMLRPQVIEMMVDRQLLQTKLKVEKVTISEKQIDEHLEEMATRNDVTVEQLRERLTSTGMGIEEFREQMKMFIGMDELMALELKKKGMSVSEADAKKIYDENPGRFNSPEQVRASHILIKTEGLDAEGKAGAKKKIEGLLGKVKGGDDFAQLAKSNSACPSSARGGDLGFFPRGQMVPEFSAAAFAMKVDGVSDVVETQFGYHIIKVTGREDADVKTFKDVKDDLVRGLEGQKKREIWSEFHTNMKSEAKVVYAEGEGKDAGQPVRAIPAIGK